MAQPGVVAPWRATYVPGDWYLIAGPTSMVVLEPGSGRAEMIADLWSDVVASASMSDLVDRLAGYGITELPDLAVVFWSQAGMRTLVRGGIQLIDPDSSQPLASGEGIVTWNEVGLGHVTNVRLGLRGQTPNGELLPLSVGVVRVGAVSVSADEDAVVRSPQPLLRSAPAVVGGTASAGTASAGTASAGAASAGAAGAAGAGAAGAGAASAGAATTGAASEPAAAGAGPDDAPAAEAGLAADSAVTAPDEAVVESGESDQSETPAGSGQTGSGQTGSGQTGRRPDLAEDDTGPDFPPLESERSDESAQTGASPGFGLDSPWGPQPGPVGAAAAVGASGASAFAPPGGVGGSTAGAPQFSVEQFEMENDDTQLMGSAEAEGALSTGGPGGGDQGRPGQGRPDQGRGGPLVEAVRCPNGHPNAPGSSVCRVCRSPITPGPPQLIPAPLLARLRAADGTVVDLDRAVLLGRAPSEQRSTAPLPRLVALASPAQDISRTHLQVVPENWQVVVTDLHSTNGTFVTDPGPNGNRGLLPPGQPIPVPIGATLELGEGVTITVEAVD
ncbi:FHA domain-containing protein [Microlunatus ginsengisoli]